MATRTPEVEDFIGKKYKHGFVTDIDADTVPPGLDEDVIRFISRKKGEPAFLLEWRLKAYRHWLTMTEPNWAHVHYPPIDYQAISYYSAPKSKKDAPQEPGRGRSRSCSRPTKSSAFRCTSAPAWPVLRSMRCSTACRSRPPSRRSWPRPA